MSNAPAMEKNWRQVDWTVLDLETTGMDPTRGQILSIGIVKIHKGAITLSEGWQSLVALQEEEPFAAQAVRVHGLLKSDLLNAPSLQDVLTELVRRAEGTVLVAHMGLMLDRPFLDAAMQRCFGVLAPSWWLDTARLAAWFDDNRSVDVPGSRAHGLQRLPDLLARYGLPAGAEHDALGDALSAAQLFLVLANKAEALGYGTAQQLRKLGM